MQSIAFAVALMLCVLALNLMIVALIVCWDVRDREVAADDRRDPREVSDLRAAVAVLDFVALIGIVLAAFIFLVAQAAIDPSSVT